MSTGAARRQEVLSDSESTLRQVQGVLSELGTTSEHEERVDRVVNDLEGKPAGLRDLVRILMTTYNEIMNTIDSLRQSRGLLEQAAMERLKSTHQKLAEVSSATEMAATGMLDGLDRALVLVDNLESSAETSGDASDAVAIRGELRDELHQLIGLLQFQDITAQQLGYAGGVLMDIEDRMVELAKVFDLRGMGLEEIDEALEEQEKALAQKGPRACKVTEALKTADPEATHYDADSRQALADEIFK